jgi:hypothetical protein
MEPFRTHTGTAVPLDRADVDTDQIIPTDYLKRIERTGFGPFLFDSWRKDPDFVLNRPEHAGATMPRSHPRRLEPRGTPYGPCRTTASRRDAPRPPTSSEQLHEVGLLPVELPGGTARRLMDPPDDPDP